MQFKDVGCLPLMECYLQTKRNLLLSFHDFFSSAEEEVPLRGLAALSGDTNSKTLARKITAAALLSEVGVYPFPEQFPQTPKSMVFSVKDFPDNRNGRDSISSETSSTEEQEQDAPVRFKSRSSAAGLSDVQIFMSAEPAGLHKGQGFTLFENDVAEQAEEEEMEAAKTQEAEASRTKETEAAKTEEAADNDAGRAVFV